MGVTLSRPATACPLACRCRARWTTLCHAAERQGLALRLLSPLGGQVSAIFLSAMLPKDKAVYARWPSALRLVSHAARSQLLTMQISYWRVHGGHAQPTGDSVPPRLPMPGALDNAAAASPRRCRPQCYEDHACMQLQQPEPFKRTLPRLSFQPPEPASIGITEHAKALASGMGGRAELRRGPTPRVYNCSPCKCLGEVRAFRRRLVPHAARCFVPRRNYSCTTCPAPRVTGLPPRPSREDCSNAAAVGHPSGDAQHTIALFAVRGLLCALTAVISQGPRARPPRVPPL